MIQPSPILPYPATARELQAPASRLTRMLRRLRALFWRDVGRPAPKEELQARVRQQATVVELGRQALAGMELSDLTQSAAALVARTLDNEFCKILELQEDGHSLLLTAGVGWKPGYVGRTVLSAGLESHAGFTLAASEPVIIDDLATTGGSKFEAIEKLTGAGLVVKDVVVLVDRQSGAKESLEQAGFNLHAVLTISALLDYWEDAGKVDKNKIVETRNFLKG